STIAAPVYDVLSRPIAAIGLSLAGDALGSGASGDALDEDAVTEPLVARVLDAAAEVTAKLR
ncbi:MAG: IclR family transcriptional regulator, partial [Brevibacterium sp.]|nr:IclR family transcriptional regulator [Brevibacterium sp.]